MCLALANIDTLFAMPILYNQQWLGFIWKIIFKRLNKPYSVLGSLCRRISGRKQSILTGQKTSVSSVESSLPGGLGIRTMWVDTEVTLAQCRETALPWYPDDPACFLILPEQKMNGL